MIHVYVVLYRPRYPAPPPFFKGPDRTRPSLSLPPLEQTSIVNWLHNEKEICAGSNGGNRCTHRLKKKKSENKAKLYPHIISDKSSRDLKPARFNVGLISSILLSDLRRIFCINLRASLFLSHPIRFSSPFPQLQGHASLLLRIPLKNNNNNNNRERNKQIFFVFSVRCTLI